MELVQKLRNLGKLRQFDKIEKVLAESSVKDIIQVVEDNIHRDDALTIWNFILLGFNNDQRQGDLFNIVLAALNQLNKVEVSHKHCFDLVIRIFGELPKFKDRQLIELVEFCVDSIRMGDPKCISWKDLLPEVMKLVGKRSPLSVNGVPMTGTAYREICVQQICTMRWISTTVTPIAMMFRDIPTSKEEKSQILSKICDNLDLLEPNELPPLANQLFLLANTASLIMIPIYGLNKYFTKHFFSLQNLDSDVSDYDSIEKYSPKEMHEAQETILYHLSKASEFRIDEREIVNFCRTIATPRCILSPFFVCALLSMSNINRYPESVLLSSSLVLPFLRSIVRNNDAEMEMCTKSAWCRATLDRKSVDLSRLLNVLMEQSKDGMEIVTPGLIWLSFAMLKASGCPALHYSATSFLEKFVKKRFIFGQGIVRNLVNFQLAELEALQYSDCLTRLSMTSAYAVSESMDNIHRVLDYLLLVPGAHAMRMMSFIIPLIKSSQKIRDLLIEMLRKAMLGRDSATRQMGVYGFCLVLKHLRENNSRRAMTLSSSNQQPTALNGSGRFGMVFSQHSISGYSLMSQTILDTDQIPQRHFDMLALEIIGMLRKCFNQTYEVKEVLYEGLLRAIDFNPKLTPHIIQFLESHLQKYVVATETLFELRIGQVIRELDGHLSVWDHLGHLVQLMGHCVVVCKQKGLAHDNRAMTSMLDTMIMRIDGLTVEDLGLTDQMDLRMMHICCQYLNCLEALMGYAIWSMSEDSSNINLILKLYKHHRRSTDLMKISNVRKRPKKDHRNASSKTLSDRPTVPFNPVNIWDLSTIMRFLGVVFNPDVSFATAEQTEPLRTSAKFIGYVLRVVVDRMHALPAQAEARHFKHSQSTFVQLGQITRIIYRQCIAQLGDMCKRLDADCAQLSVECLEQCLLVALRLYPRKFNLFLQALTMETSTINKNINTILAELQRSFELCLAKQIGEADEAQTQRVSQLLLQCIAILLDNLPADDSYAADMFTWLYKMCVDHEVGVALIHKLLFVQRDRTNTGSFFDSVALQIEQMVADDEQPPKSKPNFVLKSLTAGTLESTILYLCATIRVQIEDVEYFITKAKSFLAKMHIIGPSSTESCIQDIKSTERQVCSQLVLIAQSVLPLTNIGIPPGNCSDGVVKILNQLYVCLSNLTKHLIIRHATVAVAYQSIRFDKLVRLAGRPLASRIYELIEHIENSVFADEKYTSNPAADRAKVLRATRLLPKLVLRIENFNKFVHLLGKKTKHDLADHLHMGTVRDFKISKLAFRAVIDKSANDDEITMDNDDGIDWHDSEEEGSLILDMEQPSTPTLSDDDSQAPSVADISSDITGSGKLLEVRDVDTTRPEKALKNLALMNARIKRKRKEEPEPGVPANTEENCPYGPKPKRKKKPREPQVINKTSLAKSTTRSSRSSTKAGK